MEKQTLIQGLLQFARLIKELGSNNEYPGYQCGVTKDEYHSFHVAINKEHQNNPWFTKENVRQSLLGIAELLDEQGLQEVSEKYEFSHSPKRVAIVMAGNIPFVGFHDVLAVLMTGNIAVCKFSSSDSRIPPLFLKQLITFVPGLESRLIFSFGPLKDYEAVIATGSNNTIATLTSYFKHVPALFRKNRTSIAALDGTETTEDLNLLGQDCFQYFGMGCRNVGKIFVPEGFDLNRIFEAFLPYADVINHHKYANNYDYQRTIFLMNSIPFLDNNSFMLKEDEGLHAPLSVIFYSYYSDRKEVELFKAEHEEEIQIEVGNSGIPFGKAQKPGVFDFADNVDTFQWLSKLS